jgi:hypothetical protein
MAKGSEFMDWTQVLGIVLGNAAFVVPMFLWNRAESRADNRHMDAKLEGQRNLIDAIRQESSEFQKAMAEESKDFHKRLCEIEAKRKGE